MAQQQKNNTRDAASSKNHVKRVIGTAAVIVLLFIVLLGGFYFTDSGPFSTAAVDSEKSSQRDQQITFKPMVDIREFIVNIISEDTDHYLKTSMTVEVSDERTLEELNRRMPEVRDAVLMLISNKTFDELYDLHGKKQLKAELLMEINTILNNGDAVAIYFTDFVVQ